VLYYYVLYAAVTYLVFVFLQPIFETVVLDLRGVAVTREIPPPDGSTQRTVSSVRD